MFLFFLLAAEYRSKDHFLNSHIFLIQTNRHLSYKCERRKGILLVAASIESLAFTRLFLHFHFSEEVAVVVKLYLHVFSSVQKNYVKHKFLVLNSSLI